MTHDTQTSISDGKQFQAPFGTRLKKAREALGLDRKDAAQQLRLNEKIIVMMEKERYPTDLPVTFIRGYLRAYGKFLQIPEYEIIKAIEPIKQKHITHEGIATLKPQTIPVTSGSYFMQIFTYLIILTLLGLAGIWWYNHTPQQLHRIEPAVTTLSEPQATTAVTVNNELPQVVQSVPDNPPPVETINEMPENPPLSPTSETNTNSQNISKVDNKPPMISDNKRVPANPPQTQTVKKPTTSALADDDFEEDDLTS